jgi:hypothetical protein
VNAKHKVSRMFLSSVVVSVPLVGLSGTALANPHASSKLKITVSPNPLVETGQTEVHAVIQVSAGPGFAGKQVLISAPRLESACGGTITFQNLQPPTGSEGGSGTMASPTTSVDSIKTTLDGDDNAAVAVSGFNCAWGSRKIKAKLLVSSPVSATAVLKTVAPIPTPAGVAGSPGPEIETGNGPLASGDRDVYTVFYVETSSIYAGAAVTVSSSALENACAKGWRWEFGPTGATSTNGTGPGQTPAGTFDGDGNAVFVFMGAGCTPGTYSVFSDLAVPPYTENMTTYTVEPPQPGI